MGMNEAAELQWGTSINEYSFSREQHTGYICPGCGRAGMRVIEAKDGVSRWYCDACEDNTYVPSADAYSFAFRPTWQRMTAEEVHELVGDEPIDTSPLSDEQLNRLDAWLRLNVAVQYDRRLGPSDGERMHPVQDMELLYRAVHELKERRTSA